MKMAEMFPSKYLRAADVSAPIRDVITGVSHELVGDELKSVAHFRDTKSMVLNKTNATKLEELAGSDESNDWKGLEVELYPAETNFKGDSVACVRIRRPLPREHDAVATTEGALPF